MSQRHHDQSGRRHHDQSGGGTATGPGEGATGGTGADIESVRHACGEVTLVDGSSFCVSGDSGDIEPDSPQGLFFRDTRIVANWRLQVGGRSVQTLAVVSDEPYAATFLTRVLSSGPKTNLLVERRRLVGDGMREDLSLRNVGAAPVTTTLTLTVAADFADLFDVKDSRAGRSPAAAGLSTTAGGSSVVFGVRAGGFQRGVRISAEGATAGPEALTFRFTVAPRATWRTSVLVTPSVDGEELAETFPVGRPLDQSRPASGMQAWRESSPRVASDDIELRRILGRSLDDLGALRIVDPEHPDEEAVAAGAPWFMALFGRDSLLTSYLALPFHPSLALGTLRALARAQGQREDNDTEQQPGKILHERRRGADFPLTAEAAGAYYGTADATPLFVVVLAELCRWGIDPDDLSTLLPHADRALDWVERFGDRDGDGFVEYERMNASGLVNQGWKDSHDAISFADGNLAEPPVALCEVQGYVYAAYLARAELAQAGDDAATARHFTAKATRLKELFNERFWLADQGWFAIGLDRRKRRIDSLASNMGHCLWSGIIDEEKAAQVADRLMSAELFTGWGVRTLATSMAAYNPVSYHNGSVWPHDSALIATGLMRYGFVEAAQRIARGLLDAAERFRGRLPELFCGFDRAEYPVPVAYPTACSPQAWASATPLQLVRLLVGIEPAMQRRIVRFTPAWPVDRGGLTISGVPIGGDLATVSVDGRAAQLTGLPADVEVVTV